MTLFAIIALVTFLLLLPRIGRSLGGGDTIRIGPSGLSIRRGISKARSAIEQAQPAVPSRIEERPLAVDDDENEGSVDSYSLIMASWSELTGTFDQALKQIGAKEINWRAGARMLKILHDEGVLSDGLHEAAADLLKVRSQAKVNGPERFARLGITGDDAQQFSGSTRTIRTVVEDWLKQHSAS